MPERRPDGAETFRRIMITHFFATAAKGFETLLADELRRLKAANVRPSVGGVFFDGQLETAYRVCLWSRLASRILMPLATFSALTPEELYDGARGIDWSAHLESDSTLAVDCTLFRSRLKHSHFAALKVKDAIVDQLREKYGTRPSVALERPDVRINLH
ncbi:MAG: 23S rRNA (guanine(2445)-N(2))/(guanine(2069)-N(7))-methyltransferase, partial [Deltaproteobacteria bacterium]|nr:23S rRNA (guanine(2445)-N(2))/(guanine(2069)-N(7))-methyltransferase [Deltaproteobacteria bacterium]